MSRFESPVWSGAVLQTCVDNSCMKFEVLCAVCFLSGCNPASHKICKNNAITKTVHKVPEVTIVYLWKWCFSSICVTFIGGFDGRETMHT